MNEKMFQNVFDIVSEFLPNGWNRMVLFAGYTKGSYSIKFYSKVGSDDYVDCFSIPGVSKAELIKVFMRIDKVLSENRSQLGDMAWTIFTMAVGSDGTMKTEFEYEDHSEDMIAYEKQWKEKYLGKH